MNKHKKLKNNIKSLHIQIPKRRYRSIKIAPGKILKTTPVFDTYWKFAKIRQDIFMRRVKNLTPPWTKDPVLSTYRFTNVYRASDRVSQYLIRNVIYRGKQTIEEVFFRILLFKIFNRINTWKLLIKKIGIPTWNKFRINTYIKVFDEIVSNGNTIYSAAYIMPSPTFGKKKKHQNHLQLIEYIMKHKVPKSIAQAKNLNEVFNILRSCPSFGDFLAFQFTIDLNYSTIINFPENQFVVAGPGAKDGIKKCFFDNANMSEADIIRAVTDMAVNEFSRLGLSFQSLWGRSLQPIDCQNLFCEVDKYSRITHPEYKGYSSRKRIKQRFSINKATLPQWYPPKWKLNIPKQLNI